MSDGPDRIYLKVASPCNQSWKEMEGNGATRFCASCQKSVHNLSIMTADEAQGLLERAEEAPCVYFHARRDGSIIFGDCPTGQRLQRRQRRLTEIGAGLLTIVGLTGLGATIPSQRYESNNMGKVDPHVRTKSFVKASMEEDTETASSMKETRVEIGEVRIESEPPVGPAILGEVELEEVSHRPEDRMPKRRRLGKVSKSSVYTLDPL